MFCCAAVNTRSVMNCQKIKKYFFCDIDTSIDALQITKHICIVKLMNIGDFDPFHAWTTASIPLNVKTYKIKWQNKFLCFTNYVKLNSKCYVFFLLLLKGGKQLATNIGQVIDFNKTKTILQQNIDIIKLSVWKAQ